MKKILIALVLILSTTSCSKESLDVVDQRLEEIRIYPNPATTVFDITTKEPYTVIIYDMSGKFVGNSTDIRRLPVGLYIVMARIDGKTYNLKLIKK